MRIIFHSNSYPSATGYSTQTQRFVPRLITQLGHEVLISSFYGNSEGGVTYWNGVPVLPKMHHPYGMDALAMHARMQQADIAITLMDAWVLNGLDTTQLRFVPWFPLDSEPLSPPNRRVISRAFERIVMSRFGERLVNEAGLDCIYVPHGVPTDVYTPMDRAEARDRLGIPQDAFVIGMVAANKGDISRKCFTQQMAAFKAFKARHPDALLYIHTDQASPHGQNLPEYAEYLGLRPLLDIAFCDPYLYMLAFPDVADNGPSMVATYSAFDVLSHVSAGEGFGLASLEAQACGVPVVTGDWTAMAELCFAGWKVAADTGQPGSESMKWWTPHGTHMWWPHAWAIEERYQAAYDALQSETVRRKLAKKARNGALAYDCDRVTERYWKPALEAIEARIRPALPENAGPMLRQLVDRETGAAALAMGPEDD